MEWPDDATLMLIVLLRTQANAGSAGTIAEIMSRKLGRNISRCMVIGKARRMKMKLPGSTGKVIERSRHPKPQRVIPFKPPTPKPPTPLPPPIERAAVPQLVPEDGQCCWPIGDPGRPDFGFCQNKKDEGFSYCPGHRRLAVVPIKKSLQPRPRYE